MAKKLGQRRATIGIIGMGRMGRSLVQGLFESGTVQKDGVIFTTRHRETAQAAALELSIQSVATNKELVQKCDVLVLAVKPQNMPEILAEISSLCRKGQTLVSIVASVTTSQIEEKISAPIAVVRAMPNTPAQVRASMTAYCLGKRAGEKDSETAKMLFEPLGRLVLVDEKHMDAVTGLSGCGPAYIYMVLESLTDGGIKVGLPRELAVELASQTVLGAAKMLLETGLHPAALKDEVTTPAGCTIDGLMELEEGKLRVTLIKAVVQATRRAEELGKFKTSK